MHQMKIIFKSFIQKNIFLFVNIEERLNFYRLSRAIKKEDKLIS